MQPIERARADDVTPALHATLEGAQQSGSPILLVHGFGQNRYAWHLPARSFANHLATAGFDVYNLDLRGHGRSRHFGAARCRGIEDYAASATIEARRPALAGS